MKLTETIPGNWYTVLNEVGKIQKGVTVYVISHKDGKTHVISETHLADEVGLSIFFEDGDKIIVENLKL
jgi:hypothetical protein